MKGILILLGSGLVATTLAVAQDMPSSNNTDTTSKQTQQTHQTSSGVIRGCLSGSAGNYTITDQNGMQYTINGPDNQLQGSVGHEVEVTTSQDQASQTSTQGDQTTSSSSNSVQVSNVHDLGNSCKASSSMGNGPAKNDEDKGASPQAPDTAAPPQPQTIAMRQEQQGVGANSPQQTTPPVTSQTPATPGASTNSAQQATPPSSSATTNSTTTGTSGSQADPTAPTAATPADQGANPSTATPSAAPSNAQQPSADDQNKPLYERQATDIPWANHSGNNANSGSTGSSTPPPQH